MRGALSLVFFCFLLSCSLLIALAISSDSRASSSSTTAAPAPPKPQPRVVEDTLHGHKIADPFRWLEDGDSPATQQFVRDELAYTRNVLDPLPGRDAIHARLTELFSVGTMSTPIPGGDYYFYRLREGQVNQPVLYVRQGLHGADRVLLDANTLAADGTISLDWYYPSHNGKYVAYGTSPSGSEISTLHVIETATGKLLPDTIERTRAASVAWMPDNSGFYYTRYPKPGDVPAGQEMYNRHVFYHTMGADPMKDKPIFGEGRNPEDWPNLVLSDDGKWLLIQVEQGWTRTEIFLKNTASNAAPVRITPGQEFRYSGDIFGDEIYITTNEGAPRYRVLKTPLSAPGREHWKEIIPQAEAVLSSADIVSGKIIAHYQQDATSRLKLFSTDGKFLHDIPLPGIGNLEDVSRSYQLGGWHDSREAFFVYQSFTQPMTAYGYDLNSDKVFLFAGVKAPVDPSGYEVKQVFYHSKDRTRVPMFLAYKKGLTLNGRNPVLLTGYGGFNIINSPTFLRSAYIWLEHGGIYALANLRGGAEYGEEWHRAGMLGNKQNVFDDFIAAGEYLIAEKYTDKKHLAIQGGSNGGLLMGAALTQRPDLFRAVVCQVPLLDMLRYQNFQIAKLWIPEYGSSDDPKQFDWLYAYSPYHHVKPGTLYPSVLFMTADSDTRVDPMHAKKMAALLQTEAANGPDRPILLRIEPKAGHGAGKPISKLIEENTDIYSFLFWQLRVK